MNEGRFVGELPASQASQESIMSLIVRTGHQIRGTDMSEDDSRSAELSHPEIRAGGPHLRFRHVADACMLGRIEREAAFYDNPSTEKANA